MRAGAAIERADADGETHAIVVPVLATARGTNGADVGHAFVGGRMQRLARYADVMRSAGRLICDVAGTRELAKNAALAVPVVPGIPENSADRAHDLAVL